MASAFRRVQLLTMKKTMKHIKIQTVPIQANGEISEDDVRIIRAALKASRKDLYGANYKVINAGAGPRHRKIRKL